MSRSFLTGFVKKTINNESTSRKHVYIVHRKKTRVIVGSMKITEPDQ